MSLCSPLCEKLVKLYHKVLRFNPTIALRVRRNMGRSPTDTLKTSMLYSPQTELAHRRPIVP